MKKNISLFLLLVVLSLYSKNVIFTHKHKSDGLSSDVVYVVAQDRTGAIRTLIHKFDAINNSVNDIIIKIAGLSFINNIANDGICGREIVVKISVISKWADIAVVMLIGFVILTSLSYFFIRRLYMKNGIDPNNKIVKRAADKVLSKMPEKLRKKIAVKNKVTNSNDPEVLKYVEKMKKAMEEDKLYLDKKLSKNDLINHVHVPHTIFSVIMHNYLKVNFNDFVNKYRVEEVIRKLADPKNREFTLLGVAEDCGFNSKTSFYRTFKKFTGLTPTQYIEKHGSPIKLR